MKESAVLKAVEEALHRLLPALTASLTAEVERQLQAELAGTQTYHRKREPKDEQIVEKFNGRNAAQVARELGVSRATVYRAVKRRLEESRR
jgi:Mor family transcriptional regulator